MSSRSKNACGDSCVTTSMDMRFWRCATSRRRKRTNWSARRRLPGTACSRLGLRARARVRFQVRVRVRVRARLRLRLKVRVRLRLRVRARVRV